MRIKKNALESPRSKKLSSKPQVRDCPGVTFDGYWNNKAANHLVFDGTNHLKRDEIEHVGDCRWEHLSNKIESLASPIPDPSESKLETPNRTGSLVRRCLFFGLNASHIFAYIYSLIHSICIGLYIQIWTDYSPHTMYRVIWKEPQPT